MAKSAKKAADGKETTEGVEPMVIALAEKLGTFLGRVQAKADGWLENAALREQVGEIRDGATQLLNRVNRTAADVGKAVEDSVTKKDKAPAPPKRQGREGERSAAKSAKGRSGGAVDAPGKRHRKPPPQESINKRMGEPTGKKAGQKQFSPGSRRGRG